MTAQSIFLPLFDSWSVAVFWALLAGLTAGLLARRKNRSPLGWGILCGLTGLALGILGLAFVGLLATRKRVSMRMKYLNLKIEEQIARSLNLPSPLQGNTEEQILAILANNPQGLRIGAIAQGMAQDWRKIEDLVQRLVIQGKIRQTGDRYYFDLDKD